MTEWLQVVAEVPPKNVPVSTATSTRLWSPNCIIALALSVQNQAALYTATDATAKCLTTRSMIYTYLLETQVRITCAYSTTQNRGRAWHDVEVDV